MTIPNEYKEYFEMLNKAQRKTLKDERTKLFIKARGELCVVIIDNGIVKNIQPKIRKCDFLIYDEANSVSYLVELKGAEIAAAFQQLEDSLINIANVPECKFLLNNLSKAYAYIVSPGRMSFPRGKDEKEKALAKALARKCRIRQENIFDLIKYVTVLPKIPSFSEDKGHIICSNTHPLEL